MKRYFCASDIGSVLVGNEQVQFALPNVGGDGMTELVICENPEEFQDSVRGEKDTFVTSIKGSFNVFSYDCSNGSKEDVIATLDGRYGVYQNWYRVILVKWE